MNNLTHIRARYMRDPIPIRLGGLAADMARIASFSHNSANLPAVTSLMREAAHFIEWSAPECDLETQIMLLELQRGLVAWRAHLVKHYSEATWRQQIANNAQTWSDRILAMSGLLAETPVE